MNVMRTAARLRALRAQAAAASLVDIGRAHGLFARLTNLAPLTRAQLASIACVDERWLGDWLDGLVVAGLVDHDGARGTYQLDAALVDEHGDIDDVIFDAARALCPDISEGALLVNVGADPLPALRAVCARVAAHDEVAVAVVDAAARVSDNLDHPLGAALYARSLAQRAQGRGGVVDEHKLVRAFADANLVDVRVLRTRTAVGAILVVVGRT